MRWSIRHRGIVVAGLAGLVFTGFSARLIHLQLIKHDEYARIAADRNSIRLTISSRRGLITDRNGEILATNVPKRRVVVDGTHVKDAQALAEVAAPYLGIPEDQLAGLLNTESRYKVICHDLSEERAMALRKAMNERKLRGLYFYETSKRVYPNGSMLAHVLGYLGRKSPEDESPCGVEGVERSMEEYLHGRDGYRFIERDRKGREIVIYRGQEEKPRDGATVELTIDMGLQAILEAELDAAVSELRPESLVALMVNPQNGEILAMASRPTFDPNRLEEMERAAIRNRVIMDVVEPGSTFKIVVTSAALEEGVVNESTKIFCENGKFFYGGRVLRDHHGYGQLTVGEILTKSSNIGCAKLALMLGEGKFYAHVRMFGFGERTGVELPGELGGIVLPTHRWDKLTITRMPMGHAIAVTPLQITMAMAAVANGGSLLRPKIVRAIRDDEGREIYRAKTEVLRRVMDQKTAQLIGAALKAVTQPGGTAKLAAVPGFSVAGKTGTAQKVGSKGGYSPGKYVVSFAGYMPAENPEFVCYVLVDDAKVPPSVNYGGLVAAPIFARIGERAARYLNLVPVFRAEEVLPLAFQRNSESFHVGGEP